MHPLSRAHNDWSALVAAARRWPSLTSFDEVDDDELHLLLLAPVTVAWWVLTFAPEMLKRDRLDLLIVGLAGGPSAADEGRPYQLLPWLLERPRLQVSATVLIGTPDSPFAPPVPHDRPHISLDGADADAVPSAMFQGSLAEWWTMRQGTPPDLCLLMHPSFDQRVGFWAGLRPLLEARIPVGAFARGPEKVERDIWLLQAYGYETKAQPQPQLNPWARRRPEMRGHGPWAAVGWRMKTTVPGPEFVIDHARLKRAAEAQEFLRHEFEVWNPLQFIGQPYVDPEAAGAAAERLVGLPDHHVLSLDDGKVWALEPEGRVPVLGNTELTREELASYPGRGAHTFERLLWAVDIYRDVFRPREAAVLEALGRTQVDKLRDEVARSLQGTASREEIDAFTDFYRGGVGPSGVTPGSEDLFRALRTRQWETADRAIAGAPELVNAEDEDGRAPLFYAMNARYYDLARRWIETGADPDHLDHEGFAVLHDVAKTHDSVPVEMLARYGADLDLATALGFTPALLALRYGNWSVLGYLLAQGVDLHKAKLAGSSVAEQYETVADLPRVLKSEIEGQLGKRRVIPIATAAVSG